MVVRIHPVTLKESRIGMTGITPACRRGNAGISQGHSGSCNSLSVPVLVSFPMKLGLLA